VIVKFPTEEESTDLPDDYVRLSEKDKKKADLKVEKNLKKNLT
jgi:hypothetical protein